MNKKGALFYLLTLCCSSAMANNYRDILTCHTSVDEPGIAVWLEKEQQKIFSDAIGIADVDSRRPLEINDEFQIGSITKQFTAAAILMLAEDKLISLKSPLGDYLTDINPSYADIPLLHILSHTSGIGNYNDDYRVRRQWHRYTDMNKIVKAITKKSPQNKPGEQFAYSNTGYLLLGKVIEKVSGQSYAKFMQQRIFTPLGMTNTRVITRGTGAAPVKGYTGNTHQEPEQVDRSWIYSAGAIVSTLEDMSRWHRGLMGGTLFSQASYQKMITKATLNDGTTVNYGFGMDVYPIHNKASYGHQGGVPGFMSWMVYFPEEDTFAIAFSNNDSQHPGPAVLNIVARYLNMSPAPVAKLPPAMATSLPGKYRNKDGQELNIILKDEHLLVGFGNDEKQTVVYRENQSFSLPCTEDYFQLTMPEGKKQIIPINIYQGKQKPYKQVD